MLYDLICYERWGSDTLVVRDGLLRTRIFAEDLFVRLYDLMKAAIEKKRRDRKRHVFLVGIAKHSRIIERYRLAMAVGDVFPAGQPCYVPVPPELQVKVYEFADYIRSPEDDDADKKKRKFNMGAMYLVRFGKQPFDPLWTMDLLQCQAPQAQQVFGSLLADAELGFPGALLPALPAGGGPLRTGSGPGPGDPAERAMEEAIREQISADRRHVFDAQRLAPADPAAGEISVTLFEKAQVVGSFLGFSEGGLEFHADLILPYRNYFQSSPMHGQFVLVALENDAEAIVGRITTISAQGRLVSPAGEDYALRQQREDRPVPEDLRDQFLKYRVNIRILGVLRSRDGDKPPLFVPSHRRLPHVGAKVAFLSGELLRHVAGATADGPHAVELGFLALGEFVYAGHDARVGDDERLQVRDPAILPAL